MKLDRYELQAGDKLLTYEFLSEGSKGEIVKLIQFTLVNENNLYNLAFGDKDPVSGIIDDKVVTDNGDREKVLATVVAAVYAFTDYVPFAWIYATGSTASRTRLYRIGINKYFELMEEDFEVFGQLKGEWEQYLKGGHYEAFAVRRKQ